MTKEKFKEMVRKEAPEMFALSTTEKERLKGIIESQMNDYVSETYEANTFLNMSIPARRILIYEKIAEQTERIELQIYRKYPTLNILGSDENARYNFVYYIYFLKYPFPDEDHRYETDSIDEIMDVLTGV